MNPTEWNAITVLGRTTAEEIDDRVEVEWKLSETPELEWAEIYQMADVSERVGTREWVLGGGPDVLHDVVRWFVPADHVEDADAEVRHRLAVANSRFKADSMDAEEDAARGGVDSDFRTAGLTPTTEPGAPLRPRAGRCDPPIGGAGCVVHRRAHREPRQHHLERGSADRRVRSSRSKVRSPADRISGSAPP